MRRAGGGFRRGPRVGGGPSRCLPGGAAAELCSTPWPVLLCPHRLHTQHTSSSIKWGDIQCGEPGPPLPGRSCLPNSQLPRICPQMPFARPLKGVSLLTRRKRPVPFPYRRDPLLAGRLGPGPAPPPLRSATVWPCCLCLHLCPGLPQGHTLALRQPSRVHPACRQARDISPDLPEEEKKASLLPSCLLV